MTPEQLKTIRTIVEREVTRFVQNLFDALEASLQPENCTLSGGDGQSQLSNDSFRSGNGKLQSSNDSFRSGNGQSQSSNDSFRSGNEQSQFSNDSFRSGDGQSQSSNDSFRSGDEQFNQAASPDRLYIPSLPFLETYSNGHRVSQRYQKRVTTVLEIIYRHSGVTRKEVSAQLGIPERSVSNICRLLMKHKLIVIRNGRQGRWYPRVE